MSKFFLVILGGIALVGAGCASPAERQAADQEKCTQYGFVPGTDNFAQCMMGRDQQREYENAADQRATQQRIQNSNDVTTKAFNDRLMAPSAPPPVPASDPFAVPGGLQTNP